ncbi:Predicted nuclease (RNAse H fold) [Halomicrobium zhouii]|uniref:Predicted nuclease (RNAse H fold) n=1 Tax=Halomicrobium zhouii TaxID=767519 RepID=A0A1I6L248_9EURY|nr:DUF429 domain-containing protein [Halomicrobium zhouii]SFR97583.1 Predicted nuclease (RNAse H fold) [Halomicrobium zhouii]
MAEHVGVDWGSNGWVCARWNDGDGWDAMVLPSFLDVWCEYESADRILVDIPIGLPDVGDHRACDTEAKEVLSHAHQRVFLTPPRKALEHESYEKAKEETDSSMTTQAWSILPRIREVDTFLSEYPEAKGQIREAHPEVCFEKLDGGVGGASSKQSESGVEARIEILKQFDEYDVDEAYPDLVDEHIENLDAWGRRFRSSNRDDLLDAMGLAVMSSRAGDALRFLPVAAESPPEDSEGLPMEIVYFDPSSQ